MGVSRMLFALRIGTESIRGAVVSVMAWYLDLHLPMQSVQIATNDVSSNPAYGEVYNIMR